MSEGKFYSFDEMDVIVEQNIQKNAEILRQKLRETRKIARNKIEYV